MTFISGKRNRDFDNFDSKALQFLPTLMEKASGQNRMRHKEK